MRAHFKILMIATLAILLAFPVHAGKTEKVAMGAIDLVVGTSSDTQYSRIIQAYDFEYIGFSVNFDVTSGGNAGAGIVTFEGRVDTIGTWETIVFIDLNDSLKVASSHAPASTADLLYNGILTVVPINLEHLDVSQDLNDAGWGEDGGIMLTKFHVGNIYPYEHIRMKVVDTNWNAAVKVDGFWILRKW